MNEFTNKIPKVIHYCWFGGGSLPVKLKKCIDSWSILIDDGYQIKRWDETNCKFNENEFVKEAYKNKKWAFIADYYRAKALYEEGGIYLDTDVIVKNNFDNLLNNHAFIGFCYDVALSTAVIGSEKNSDFIKGILEMYEKSEFINEDTVIKHSKAHYKKSEFLTIPNNEFITWYVIEKYPSFKLNNSKQDLENVLILPKKYFDTGAIFGKYYCRHLCYNSWKSSKTALNRFSLKEKLKENQKLWTLIRFIKYKKAQKTTTFWKYRKIVGYKKAN